MHDAWRPGARLIDLDFNDEKKIPYTLRLYWSGRYMSLSRGIDNHHIRYKIYLVTRFEVFKMTVKLYSPVSRIVTLRSLVYG